MRTMMVKPTSKGIDRDLALEFILKIVNFNRTMEWINHRSKAMKLTELAIDGFANFRHLQIGRFSDGLNFVYGENGAGKSALRDFIRGVVLGFEPSYYNDPTRETPRGHLNVRQGVNEFRLDREHQAHGQLLAHSIGSPTGQPFSALATGMNADLYDTVFNYSFHNTRDNARRFSDVLQTQLGVPRGPAAVGDEVAYLNWKRDADGRANKLASIQQRIDELSKTKFAYQTELESADANRRNRLAELDSQLQSLLVQINGFDGQAKQTQLVAIDRELASLRALIEQSVQHVSYVPQTPTANPFAAMYQRLDEIDNQIRRWRRVQTDIQSQRVRLKDEMVVWNDLTLDSNDNPYHNAREILVSLEHKVDQAERQAGLWSQTPDQRTDPAQLSIEMRDICNQMRQDLYGLCQELGQQYKHIRQKAAAAELKQLRRCYNEMGENTQRLVRRRDDVIKEIRSVDPAGADAVERSENGFCQCAAHEGYLQARQKFVASPLTPVASDVTHRVVQADMTEERRRLELLENQRREMLHWLANSGAELTNLKARYADLQRTRDSLSTGIDTSDLQSRLQTVESELHALDAEYQVLIRLVEEDRRYVKPSPNAILTRASQLIEKVTTGELQQVYLSDTQSNSDFQIRDRIGKVLNFTALDPSQQDQVYLCLSVAAKEALLIREIDAPLVIDNAFTNITRERIDATLGLFTELVNVGHQFVLLTQHRYLADRVPGVQVFELPPSTPLTQPFVSPERSPATPVTPARDANLGTGHVATNYNLPVVNEYSPAAKFVPAAAFTPPTEYASPEMTSNVERSYLSAIDSALPVRSYPFSKYPVTDELPDANDAQFIVQHPTVRFETAATSNRGTGSISSVPVNSVGDQLGYTISVDDATNIGSLEFFDAIQIRTLTDAGVESVGQLLELNLESLPAIFRTRNISAEQIDRWQSQAWLLSNIPGLRTSDCRILVACGVTEPSHLATSHAQQLSERIHRFLSSSEGQRFASSSQAIPLDRIQGWYQGLDATRSRWQSDRGRRGYRRTGSYSNDRSRNGRGENGYSRSERTPRTERGTRERATQTREDRGPRIRTTRSRRQEPLVARTPRMQTPQPAPRETTRNSAPALAPTKKKTSSSSSSGGSKNRFYLDLGDHIEAAPSIGPKTAERFEKIGVVTVADFLKQTAESMAAKLNYKRITAEVVRTWQHQARLVCRIPNLRGHDAQLLVACDFTEPEKVATMQPKQLLDIIGPFSDTKEGLKIIRNGKKPDLEEITDWISWAGSMRSLQAA